MSRSLNQMKKPSTQPNITQEDITKGNILYEGDYCDIIEVIKGDHVYAVKCIFKNRIDTKIYQMEIKQITNEITTLYKCKHPNIIQLLGHFESSNMIALIFPKFGKPLRKFIISKKKKEGSPFTLDIFVRIFRQVGQGIKQIHSLGFVHRDITSDNILLNKDYQVKIIDFGYVNTIHGRKTKTGTREYLAPEILEMHKYNHKVDLWSFGIVCFQMLYGCYPFKPKAKNLSDQQLQKLYIKNMMKPLEWDSDQRLIVSEKPPEQMLESIKSLLSFNPQKRPEIGLILSKEWFNPATSSEQQLEEKDNEIGGEDQRKTTKLLTNMNFNLKQMSVKQLQTVLFNLSAMHSNELYRQKQLLQHLFKSEKKLVDLKLEKYKKS